MSCLFKLYERRLHSTSCGPQWAGVGIVGAEQQQPVFHLFTSLLFSTTGKVGDMDRTCGGVSAPGQNSGRV